MLCGARNCKEAYNNSIRNEALEKIANLRERHEAVELGRALMVFSGVRKIAKSDY